MDDHDTLTPDNTRRDFLRKTAIGAAVAGGAWVAPTVLSLDAAHAAGTCGTGTMTFPWSLGGNGTTHTPGSLPIIGSMNGIDVRIIDADVSGGTLAGAGDNFMTRSATSAACPPQVNCGSAATTNWPRGNQQSFYSLLMNNTATCNNCNANGTINRFTEVTFGFFDTNTNTARPVHGLTFDLYDIDSGTGEYQDRVSVFANGSATPVGLAGSATPIATATRVNNSANTTVQPIGNTAVFNAIKGNSAGSGDNFGNVHMVFNGTNNITTIRIQFMDILTNNANTAIIPTTVQWVGIGDLTFCKVFP